MATKQSVAQQRKKHTKLTYPSHEVRHHVSDAYEKQKDGNRSLAVEKKSAEKFIERRHLSVFGK